MARSGQKQCQTELTNPARTLFDLYQMYQRGNLHRGNPAIKDRDRIIKIVAHKLGVPCDDGTNPYHYDREIAAVNRLMQNLDVLEKSFGIDLVLSNRG